MKWPSLILASASPRRAQLLRDLGVTFRVVPSQVAELHPAELTAVEVCQINAYRKARSVSKHSPDTLVLAADTLVCRGTRLFGKPANLEEAHEMLRELQGTTHQVVTALCLMNLRRHRRTVCSESTYVTFRSLDAAGIRRYLSQVNPLDKAGGYAIQEHGELIIERISGSYSNVVGLPVERLRRALDLWATAFPPHHSPQPSLPA